MTFNIGELIASVLGGSVITALGTSLAFLWSFGNKLTVLTQKLDNHLAQDAKTCPYHNSIDLKVDATDKQAVRNKDHFIDVERRLAELERHRDKP